MTEKLTCPNCGYTKLEVKGFRETGFIDGRGCPYCECIWDERRRQPPKITPEMAYEWFCKKQFEQYACLAEIVVDECGDLYFKWLDGNVSLELDHCMVEALGWQDMPPMTREDFANNANCSGIGKDGE